MEIFSFSRRHAMAMLVAIVVIDIILLIVGFQMGWRAVSSENGLVEDLQLVTLAGAFGLFAAASYWSMNEISLVMAECAAASLLMFQRELNLRFLPDDHWLRIIDNDLARGIFWGVVCLWIATWIYRLRERAMGFMLGLRLRHGWPIIPIALFMVASLYCERTAGGPGTMTYKMFMRFMEETTELNGYMIITGVAAVLAIAAYRRRAGFDADFSSDGRNDAIRRP